MKLFGTDPVQGRVVRFVIQMKSSSMSVKADGNRKGALKPLISCTARLSQRNDPERRAGTDALYLRGSRTILRIHLLAHFVVPAAAISSNVGACQRRTVQPPALAR